MSVFKSVLVGIDLLQIDSHDSNRFSPPVKESIKHALWIAEKASASLTFFAAVDMPEHELHSLEAGDTHVGTPELRLGRLALNRLVDSARQRGLTANAKLVSGEAWIEIILEVEKYAHDVVIVGTRNVGAVRRFLFGSTAMSLLHNCPCPVWITRPETRPFPHNILIASDFSPVSEIAVKLGLAIGDFCGAKVNLLHAVDYLLDRRYSVGLLHTNTEQYHAHVNAEALQQLTEQLTRVAGGRPTAEVELYTVPGGSVADPAILEFIDHHQIDLLVMGEVARDLSGLSMDNTSERLVTHLPCSMLAVKPPGFVSPID